jgi:hypothetical protein
MKNEKRQMTKEVKFFNHFSFVIDHFSLTLRG